MIGKTRRNAGRIMPIRSTRTDSEGHLPNIFGTFTNWHYSTSISSCLTYRPIFSPYCVQSKFSRHFKVHNPSYGFLLLLLSGDVSVNPGPASSIKISSTNVQSLHNKSASIQSFIRDNCVDCFLMSETWLTESDTESHLRELTPEGFRLHHETRGAWSQDPRRRGGGVGCFVSERLNSSLFSSNHFSSFQYIITPVDFCKIRTNLVTIYRPPKSPSFLDQLQTLFSELISMKSSFIITGDFNIHLDVADNHETLKFKEILNDFNLKQHVTTSTHTHGHILDVFITPEDFNHIVDISVSDSVSDHLIITATLNFEKPKPTTHKVQYRPYRKIDLAKFRSDLAKSTLLTNPSNTATSLYNQYHTVMTELVDRHAPLKTRTCTSRPRDPWITEDILDAKREKRRLERRWRSTGFVTDRKLYMAQVHEFNQKMSNSKNDWYTKLVQENERSPRKLWNSINRLLYRNMTSPLPDCSDPADLANDFGLFFKSKIDKIRAAFNLTGDTDEPSPPPPPLNAFREVTEDEVRKIISSSPNKQCDLDPCPTSLVKDCLDQLASPITKIINLSLSEGIFPECFKKALVTPLLKKPSLSKNSFSSYRPVSNLNFISKILEKVVALQIKKHIDGFGLDNPFQSAYKAFHSTETALLSVQNDIFAAMENGNVSALTLLDLSAAFDTIDHDILLRRLTDWFGIGDVALKWVTSYLDQRSQSININGTLSIPFTLLFGVPQGSVLGPLLFIMYTTPLSKLLKSAKDIFHHLYADDTQVYNFFNTSNFCSSIKNLQNCLVSVKDWMFKNKLKLNPDKTEFLLIGNQCHRKKFDSYFPIDILGNLLTPAPHARNLGVTYDANLDFKRHINNTIKSCNYYIRDLRRVRKHLNLKTSTALANALVSSRLDYCNSLLYSVSATYLKKLQRVQNSLARVVTNSPKFTHTTPLLYRLHWLPVKSRIQFKLATIIYKCIYFDQPSSLANHLHLREIQKSLMSQTRAPQLSYPFSKAKSFGRYSFRFIAPVVWNELPPTVRQAKSLSVFRRQLKTYYFTKFQKSVIFPT